MKKIMYAYISLFSCMYGAEQDPSLLLKKYHEIASTIQNREDTYTFIKELSCEFNCSNMRVAEHFKESPIFAEIVDTQKKLFCWDNQKALHILQEAKSKGADLNFTYDMADPVCPWIIKMVTPLQQFAKTTLYLPLSTQEIILLADTEHYKNIGKWFIENGSSYNQLNDDAFNVLMIATGSNNQPLAMYLAETPLIPAININQQDHKGETALFMATIHAVYAADGPKNYRDYKYLFALKIIEKLIKAGANPFLAAKSFMGNPQQDALTPRQYAADVFGSAYGPDSQALLNLLTQAENDWNSRH